MRITQCWGQAQKVIHDSRDKMDKESVVILFKDLLAYARSSRVPRGTVQKLEEFIAERGGGQQAAPVIPEMEEMADRVSW